MKKKLAVVFSRMIVGGAERSLIQFLRAVDYSRYEVTLFTRNAKGAFFDEIPEDVCVVFTECKDPTAVLRDDLKHFRLWRVIKGLFARIFVRFCKSDYWKFAFPMMTYPDLPGRYDCAVAYKLGCEDTAELLTRVKAKRKCGFVHHIIQPGGDGGVFRHMRSVEKIFCVSHYAKKCLDQQFPALAAKTDVLHNLVDAVSIRTLAQEQPDVEMRKSALVTVGRLEQEKGQDLIPEAARLVLDAGYEIFWYLVGDGSLRGVIEKEMERHHVEDHVILLGTKQNPYPYMKNCHIYVQTSRSEGWCLTTQEAKILHRPVVTTDLPVMYEQFSDGINGSIAAGVTAEALAQEIVALLEREELRESYIRNLQEVSCDGAQELCKLYDFIES